LGRNFTFQQDNDPKHTFKPKRKIRDIKKMKWLAQSPDLSLIELLWDEIDRQAKALLPSSADILWKHLQDSWLSISNDCLMKLLHRMPKICAAVITAKSGHFDVSVIIFSNNLCKF
jgi:hypothetical protein